MSFAATVRIAAVIAISGLTLLATPVPSVASPSTSKGTATAATHPSVTNLDARPLSSGGVQLRWLNPVPTAHSSGVMIRRVPGRADDVPLTAGVLVANLRSPATRIFTDREVAPGNFTYAVFAEYGHQSVSAATTVSTLTAYVGPKSPTATARTRSADDEATGAVTGRVLDAANHPLAGVEVSADPVEPFVNDGLSATGGGGGYLDQSPVTDRTGTFTLTGLTPGRQKLCFQAVQEDVTGGSNTVAGYRDSCSNDQLAAVSVSAGQTTNSGKWHLAQLVGGEVDGTVSTSRDALLKNVQVLFRPAGSEYATTDAHTNASGTFTAHLPAGQYTLCYETYFATGGTSTTGYQPETCPASIVTVTNGTATAVDGLVADGGAISGVVRQAGNGRPLQSVPVYAKDSAGNVDHADTLTASDGSYTIVGLAPGSYTVCADTSDATISGGTATTGYASKCYGSGATVAASEDQTQGGINFSLAAGGAVTGTVRDGSGNPISDVYVDAQQRRGSDYADMITDASGQFELTNLPNGLFDVCFYARGYDYQCWQNEDDSSPDPVRVTLGQTTSGIDATLTTGGSAESGTLRVIATNVGGSPIAGSNAVLLKPCTPGFDYFCQERPLFSTSTPADLVDSQITGIDGAVDFGAVPAGRYAVCFFNYFAGGGTSRTGYSDACTARSFNVVVTANNANNITKKLPVGGAATGRVTDPSATPVSGVLVNLSANVDPDYGSGEILPDPTTQPDGTWRSIGLPTGTQNVCFDPSIADVKGTYGYAAQCYDAQPPDGTPTPVTIARHGSTAANVNAQLSVGGNLTGTIYDASTHQPLSGVLVYADNEAYLPHFGFQTTNDVYSGASGSYTIVGLTPGTYNVCFQAEGHAGGAPYGYGYRCATTTVTAAATTSRSVLLTRSAAIVGTVTTADSSPLPLFNADVVAYKPGTKDGYNYVAEAYTDPDGTYEMDLPAGTYDVCVEYGQTSDGGGADYQPSCYLNVTWAGQDSGGPPSAATALSVTAGNSVTVDLTESSQ